MDAPLKPPEIRFVPRKGSAEECTVIANNSPHLQPPVHGLIPIVESIA